MSNNYYIKETKTSKEKHIGKFNHGRKFMFTTSNGMVNSYSHWKSLIEKNSDNIYDECDRKVSMKDLYKIIELNQDHKPKSLYPSEKSFLDDKGFHFSKQEFC